MLRQSAEVANPTTAGVPDDGDALKELGAVSLGQVRLGLKMRARVWAWRNAERWASFSLEELTNRIAGHC